MIPLFSLTALALPAALKRHTTAFRLSGSPVWALSAVSVAIYLVHTDTRYYGEWLFDSSTKQVVNLLRERQRERPVAKARGGIHWVLEPSLNFYRRIYKLDWMAPLDRRGPDGDYDYYVLLGEEGGVPLIKKRGLRVLYSGAVSGVYLAEPGR